MCMGKSWWDSVYRRHYFNDGNASVNYFSCTYAPAPSPPPDIGSFVLDGKFLGEGIVNCHIPYGIPKCYAIGIKKPQLATLPTCLQ